MVRDARYTFIESGITDPQQYRFLWVDHDWYFFSIFRDTYGLNDRYAHLLKETCDILFFPGCMLSCIGPHMVESASQWLSRSGDSVGILLDCCGAPLFQIGLYERFEDYTAKLYRKIKETGARQIITACPTCHAHLIQTFKPQNDVEIISLFKLMAESDLKAPVVGDGTVTVHDSCSDQNGEIGKHIRKLLTNYELREMVHHGTETICCGSGGIVSAVNPELCEVRAQTRLNEVVDCRAETCITYCMSCAHRLAVQADTKGVGHILELIFDEWVDHKKFNDLAGAMWDGELGEKNAERLQGSKIE